MSAFVDALQSHSDKLLADLEAIYKDLHQHPELSMQEFRTTKIAADYIDALGYEMTREVGGTGVVSVLRNGADPTVMLRADMDALPMAENTGLPYASSVKAIDEEGVEVDGAHSCGHDMHVTWMMGVARVLAEHRDAWKGTVNAERPPEFTTLSTYPMTENDEAATLKVAVVFKRQFGDKALETRPASPVRPSASSDVPGECRTSSGSSGGRTRTSMPKPRRQSS